MRILFVIYAGLIPIVPLIGLEIYRAKKNKKKAIICAGLFVMQVLISTVSIIAYLEKRPKLSLRPLNLEFVLDQSFLDPSIGCFLK